MKNTIVLFLAVTTIVLGAVCVVQFNRSAAQQTQLAAMRSEAAAQSQQIEDLQAAQKRSDQQRHQLINQAEELATQLQARQAAETNDALRLPQRLVEIKTPVASTNSASGSGGFGKMLSKMMQDPDTRKMIRDQQRMMMDQMYAPLVKKLGLTPDEASKFKDLIADNAMQAADKASSMFGGAGGTNQTEAFKAMSADQKTFDEQVKDFLGDDRYAQYKDYQETVSERTLLNQFKLQAGSDYNLSDLQTEALLGFMKEEQKRVAANTGLPLGETDKDPAKLQALFAGDKVDELLKAQDTIGQRAYERARTILSPDQLDTWGRYQTNRMNMMRMGMTMMRKMFVPDNSAAGGTPPNQ